MLQRYGDDDWSSCGSVEDNDDHDYSVDEFDYSPYNCFNNTSETAPGKYVITSFGDKIPMVFAIKAEKLKKRLGKPIIPK